MQVNLTVIQLQLRQPPFGQADAARRQRTDFQNGRSETPRITAGTPREIVRRDPPLLVGGAGQRNRGPAARDRIGHLHHVSRRVNRRIGGAQELIRHNMSARPEFQPRRFRQLRIWTDSDAHDREIRLQLPTVLQFRKQCAVAPEGDHLVAEFQRDPQLRQFGGKRYAHLLIHRRQHLRSQFNHGHFKAAVTQILRDFEPDEARADHQCPFRPLPDSRQNPVHIRDGPQLMDGRIVAAGQFHPERRRTGRQQQPVVAFLIGGAVRLAHGKPLHFPVDRNRLVFHAHIDGETRPEPFRRHHQQRIPFRDHSAQMVGQTTVGK